MFMTERWFECICPRKPAMQLTHTHQILVIERWLRVIFATIIPDEILKTNHLRPLLKNLSLKLIKKQSLYNSYYFECVRCIAVLRGHVKKFELHFYSLGSIMKPLRVPNILRESQKVNMNWLFQLYFSPSSCWHTEKPTTNSGVSLWH